MNAAASRSHRRMAAVAVWLLVGSGALAAVEVWPDCLPRASAGTYYSVDIYATGGTAPYTFAITAGSIPAGFSVSPPLRLYGIPVMPGTYAFQVTATDSLGASGFRDYVLIVEDVWDILVGDGASQVRVYTRAGTATTVVFTPYASTFGINVASGNIDGGATWEILTAPGPSPVYGPHVRAFRYDGTVIAKVSFYAYGTLKYGAKLTSGDIDGDGFDEILTAPGPGAVFGPHIRAFDFDGTVVRPIAKVNFFAYGTLKYGANIASGDLDGDCIDEIVTGTGPGAVFAPTVRTFNYDGQQVTTSASFNAFAAAGYGVVVDAGDVDNDHFDEIVAAPGPNPSQPARVLGFDVDGGPVTLLPGYDVTPFPTMYGAELGMAGIADPTGAILGGEDVIVAPGPDPAATGAMQAFAYTGSGLLPIWAGNVTVGPVPLNIAGGKLGYP